jgi:Mg-chelatase subunit ChlI
MSPRARSWWTRLCGARRLTTTPPYGLGRGHRNLPYPPRRRAHRAAHGRRRHPAVSPLHQTVSDVGLIGGGQVPMPGEGSRAHTGVLCVDELPEWKRHVLGVLRQPLEKGVTSIQSAARV